MKTTSIYTRLSTDVHPLDRLSAFLAYAKQLRWFKGHFDESSYHAALHAASLSIELQSAFDLIASMITTNGGHLRVAKLRSQINRAFAYAKGDEATDKLCASGKVLSFPQAHKWPEPDHAKIAKTAAGYGGLADLWEASPIRFASEVPRRTEMIVDALFPSGALLCAGRDLDDCHTASRDAWRGHLTKFPFIVPNPMSKLTGISKEGKMSVRCLDNTGPRRFIIVEFDKGEQNEQAALLLHLRESAPLALVVWSGRRSLQGWFYCDGVPEERLREWFGYAVRLGADKMMWTRCQACRMPEAYRHDQLAIQTCYYFAPEATQEVPQ